MTIVPNFKIKGDKKLNNYIKKQAKYLKDPKKTFARIKIVMLQDMLRHFKEQKGDKGKWTPLKPATLFRRRKEGKGARILRDTGKLMNSLTPISSKSIAEVGTRTIYAKTHNFGDKKRKIPQRKFAWLSTRANKKALDFFILDLKRL